MENSKELLTPEIKALVKAYKAGEAVPDLQIAEASYTVLDGYRWLPYPTPPQKVVDYYKLPTDTRKKMNSSPDQHQGFFNDPVVKNYFDEKDRIKNKNFTNKQWLEWMKTIITDEGKLAGINIMLHKFSDDYINFVEQPAWTD